MMVYNVAILFILSINVCDTDTVRCRWVPIERYVSAERCNEMGALYASADTKIVAWKCAIGAHEVVDR